MSATQLKSASALFSPPDWVSPDNLKEQLASRVLAYDSNAVSGLPYIAYSQMPSGQANNIVVRSTALDEVKAAEFARTVMPTSGVLYYDNAVLNHTIVDTATRPIISTYKGRQDVDVADDLKYHPLGILKQQTGDSSVWAYDKPDIFYGIQANAMTTSLLEYLPQKAQAQALRDAASLSATMTSPSDDAVHKMYLKSLQKAQVQRNANSLLRRLDSQNYATQSSLNAVENKRVAERQSALEAIGKAQLARQQEVRDYAPRGFDTTALKRTAGATMFS